MNNPEKIITRLIDIAIDHYFDGLQPDVYAATAAFTFSKAVAAESSAESADAATFVATQDSASSIIDITHHLAKQAVSDTNTRHAMKAWRMTPEPQENLIPATHPTGLFFQKIVENQASKSRINEANKLYQSTFDASMAESNNHRAALNAARAHYLRVYSSAHASYRYAIEMAARFSTDATRRATFASAIRKRLSAELNHQPIEPGFFIEIMCSITTSIIAWVLLVSGLIALSLGIAGLIYPAVSGVILSAGLSLASVTIAGTGIATVGAGVLTCQFFTTRQWKRDNDASRQAVDSLQGLTAVAELKK